MRRAPGAKTPPTSPKPQSSAAAALRGPPNPGGLQGISEDSPKVEKKKGRSSPPWQETTAGRKYVEVKGTYGVMSVKARGQRLHQGPLELRDALPARDCTSWVRANKQYSPYSGLERPDALPTEKPAKSAGPPPLWLPPRSKDPKKQKEKRADNMRLGAEAGEDAADNESVESDKRDERNPLEDRPPWIADHHIMFSRMNSEVQVGVREYFDKPKRTEADGIPKVREKYVMGDRQMNWDDSPAPLGQYRKTLYDNIGPYNRGGCKEQQLPSYWRKIQDWHSYSSPDLALSLTGSGRPRQRPKEAAGDKKALLLSLADAPSRLTKDFWRGWAEAQATPGSLPRPSELERPRGWDKRWAVSWSRANDAINMRQREYFSVPEGGTGTSLSPARRRRKMDALLRAAEGVDRFTE